MKETNTTCYLVIFGAKGDLACRKLLPSLYQLEKIKKLSKNMKIIGVGRANWDKNIYSTVVRKSLEKFMNENIKKNIWNIFSLRLEFCNLDVNNIHSFYELKKMFIKTNHLIINYFAVPPNTFSAICQGLGKINLNLEPTRIIIEKPLGSSLQTSQNINHEISKYFKENQIFRIDHYLGKETILNLLAFRFSNSIFYHNWNNNFIDHIQITIAEKIGVEGRKEYFDNTGQIRDMVQNHLLQILTIITMSPPTDLCSENIQNEKIKVLKSLRPFNKKNIHKKVILGQYSSGIINEKKIPSYLEDIGENIDSKTETFVSMKVNIDNKQWYGVPFYLRTGKRLPKKYSEIVVYFKNIPINIFNHQDGNLPKNKVIISLQPNEGINIQILNKIPGLESNYKLDITNFNFSYSQHFKKYKLFDAYERLLLESIRGNRSLFVSRDEVELAWHWIDSIFSSFSSQKKLLHLYPSGTWGPRSSHDMMQKDGYEWNDVL
ncbi:MAG: glucose-6-phosphate dehydrogenase [Buchnera aphidicola (Kaburagia rhusicola ensigallis)]